MKKLLTLFVLSALVFAVIGCGEGGTNTVESTTPQGSGDSSRVIEDPKGGNRNMSTPAEAGTE